MAKEKAVLKIESFTDDFLVLSTTSAGVKTLIRNIVDMCKEKYSGYVKVTLEPPRPSRTLPQNAKWWAMCTEYGNFLGMTKDEVSEGIKCLAMDEGLWEGSETPFSKTGRKEPISTADADTAQMAVLIDVLYREAAEHGFTFEEDL